MWSGIYQQQINGRVWRYGQIHPVIIYHLLACGTTDIVMNGMANEKNTLIRALVNAEKNTILEKFRDVEEDEDDPIEDDEGEDLKKVSKGKKGKARPQPANDEEEVLDKSKKRRKGKGKALNKVANDEEEEPEGSKSGKVKKSGKRVRKGVLCTRKSEAFEGGKKSENLGVSQESSFAFIGSSVTVILTKNSYQDSI